MLMILPVLLPLLACIARISCFMLSSTPTTFVSNVAATVSAVCSVIGPTCPSVAALFTATSSLPNRAIVFATRFFTSSSFRTSARMYSASPPSSFSSRASTSPASSRRPDTITRAPFLANANAAARPMPVRAPVIRTTWSFILDFSNLIRLYVRKHIFRLRERKRPLLPQNSVRVKLKRLSRLENLNRFQNVHRACSFAGSASDVLALVRKLPFCSGSHVIGFPIPAVVKGTFDVSETRNVGEYALDLHLEIWERVT